MGGSDWRKLGLAGGGGGGGGVGAGGASMGGWGHAQ